MEDFPRVIQSTQLPLDIPIRPYLKDHCFNGHAVLPAVEAMETLAQTVRRFRPATNVAFMSRVTFDKFLYLDPEAENLSASIDISVYANGDVTAALTTETTSKHAVMARVKTHAALTMPRQAPPMPVLPLDVAAAPEGVCSSISNENIYPDLVAFGPFYRNVAGLHMTHQGAVAEIRNPVIEEAGSAYSNLLGSPFALDAAFHAACIWGQRFAGVVAFPVAVDLRRIYIPTLPAEAYFVHVMPIDVDPALLVFDLRIYDREGRLHEACSGVRMRDVSGGRMSPPEWFKKDGQSTAAKQMADACRAAAVIELAALSAFAEQTLSVTEHKRYVSMSGQRRKSYLAARLACKRIARRLSANDTHTAPEDITTVCADRPHLPCCTPTDGSPPYPCSVSHDDRFAVAVAADRRVGVDVEKVSERLLKYQALFMTESEQVLVLESQLGDIETAVRIWSIKEAVAKALDITLAAAWQRAQVCGVGFTESRYQIDGQGSYTAVHASIGPHVFTLV